MESLQIKKVVNNRIGELEKISRQTFFETFSAENSGENMSSYLDNNFSKEQLSRELDNSDSRFYFAETDNNVVGYLKVNVGPSQTELKKDNGLEIERIYVLKEYHGKKAGQLLLDKAIAVAMELQAGFVWLGVWEKNTRAIDFYKKNGFVEFDKHLFKLGNDEQTDIMMRKG